MYVGQREGAIGVTDEFKVGVGLHVCSGHGQAGM